MWLPIKNTCTTLSFLTLRSVRCVCVCTSFTSGLIGINDCLLFTHLNAALTKQNFINILSLHVTSTICDAIAEKLPENRIGRWLFPWQVDRVWWCIMCYCHHWLSYWHCCRRVFIRCCSSGKIGRSKANVELLLSGGVKRKRKKTIKVKLDKISFELVFIWWNFLL